MLTWALISLISMRPYPSTHSSASQSYYGHGVLALYSGVGDPDAPWLWNIRME